MARPVFNRRGMSTRSTSTSGVEALCRGHGEKLDACLGEPLRGGSRASRSIVAIAEQNEPARFVRGKNGARRNRKRVRNQSPRVP
jgi:hypothetical protein